MAGEYPGHPADNQAQQKINAHLHAGVTTFVDLTTAQDNLAPYAPFLDGKAQHLSFPIPDVSVPHSTDYTNEILDAIDQALTKDGITYVHCWGGRGRTGVIIGCWLARQGLSGVDALDCLHDLWQDCAKSKQPIPSPETQKQVDYVVHWNTNETNPVLSRYLGAMLGLAAGDALGTTVEFRAPGSFPPVTDITGGGPFHLNRGEWTDDTSMSLCLADSLLTCTGFKLSDQMDCYVRWMDEGYMSCNGRCFDIGNTVRSALVRYKQTGDPIAGSTDPRSAGNGSIMRLAPVPLFYARSLEIAVSRSADSSTTTHGARTCIDACRYFGALIALAVNGTTKEDLLSRDNPIISNLWQANPLCPEIKAIAQGSYKTKEPPAIVGSGYVVQSLEAALWAFHKTDTFKDGCLLAVNLGNDADTTGAIYGQLAGAHYGIQSIPSHWRHCISHAGLIKTTALRLHRSAQVFMADMIRIPEGGTMS